MYKYYFILSNLLRFNYKNLKSIVNLSILVSTFFCVILVPISLSVINGFEKNILSKIISFDGYARVYLDEINSTQYNKIENIPSITKFYENEGLIKTSKGSEVVTIFSSLDSYPPLYDMLGIEEKNNQGIFIGQSLYDKLFSINSHTLQKKVILINSDNNIQHIEVLGIFQTHVPLYDEHFVLSNMKGYSATGFIADKGTYDALSSNIKPLFYTYNERYYDFLKWLTSYDLPIFILLSSILFIGLVNNIFCFKIDLTNRKTDTYIFNLLGLPSKQVYLIYFYKYALIIFLGIFFGSIASIFLIYLQLNYNFIKIPEGIYFTSSIPLSVKLEYFIYTPIIFLFQSFYLFIENKRNFNVL